MPPGVPFADDGIDLEIAEWKAARKLKKRSFREPWRSVAIAATLMFGTASWLLPDSVADIVQLVTLGLTAAAFVAGFSKAPNEKRRPSGPPFSQG